MSVRRVVRLLSLALCLAVVGCAVAKSPVYVPRLPPTDQGELTQQTPCAILSAYYLTLSRRSPASLGPDIERAKKAFRKAPSVENRRRLTFFLSLPNVLFASKVEVLELMARHNTTPKSGYPPTLYFLPESSINQCVRRAKIIEDLQAKITTRDKQITRLNHQLKGVWASRAQLQADKASLEQRLEEAQALAHTLRGQLDELRKIEKSLEDRSQSTPLELPKQNAQPER